MPTFKCTKCENREIIPHVRFVWNEKNNRLEAKEQECPDCGGFRDVEKEEGKINVYFKAENAKNYDNKKVKKYDYDVEAARSSTATISTKKP